MRLPRRALDAYNAAVKQCGDGAERASLRALSVWLEANPDAEISEVREFCKTLLHTVGASYGQSAGDAAYALRSLVADRLDIELPDVDYAYEPDPEYVDKTARYQVEKLKAGDPDGFGKAISDAARYFAERGANDTMTNLGEHDAKKLGKRVLFARVPTGATTCPYCLMLASRGFVYSSELKALNANHRNCDCRIVEGFPGMTVEGYDPDAYYDMWKHPEKYAQQTGGEELPRIELRTIEGGQYPDEFTNTRGKRQSFEAFTEAVNSIEGADPKMREIFSRMEEIADSPNLPENFDVKYAAGRGSVNTWTDRRTGEIQKVTVSVPKMTKENIRGTVSTTCHEFGHFIDLMRGESGDRWLSSRFADFLTTDYLSLPPSERRAAAATRSEQVKPKDRILEVMRGAEVKYQAAVESVRQWHKAEYERITDEYDSIEDKTLEDRKQNLKQYKKLRREYDARMDAECRMAMDGVDKLEDIYDALNDGYLRGKEIDGVKIRYGHGDGYYRTKSKQVEEIWANYCAMSLTRPDLIELLREDQPMLIQSMDAMRDEVLRGLDG
jgi:hypothetical protein